VFQQTIKNTEYNTAQSAILFLSCLQSTDIPDDDFVLRDRMEDINRLFAGDTVEEIVANLKNDGSSWAQEQLKILSKMVSSLKPNTHL